MKLKKLLVLLAISLLSITSGAITLEPIKDNNENCAKGYIVIKFKLETILDNFNKPLKTARPVDISIVESIPVDAIHEFTVNELGRLRFTNEFTKRMKIGDDGYYTQKMNIVSNSTCTAANKALNKDATNVAPIS